MPVKKQIVRPLQGIGSCWRTVEPDGAGLGGVCAFLYLEAFA